MSAPSKAIAESVPEEWQAFLRSGEYSGARASISANGKEVQVDFAARVEFVDDHQLAIHVAFADTDPGISAARARSLICRLTARERAVITLIAMGRETREIAESMGISPETVRSHVRNSMSKLGAHTRAQLVAVVMSSHDARAA